MLSNNEQEEKRPKGKAIRWSPIDILHLSTPTPADVEEAKRFWRSHAPAKYRNLLDAEPDDGSSKHNP